MKYGSGNVIVYGYFAASGSGRLAVNVQTIHSASYKSMLEENVNAICPKVEGDPQMSLSTSGDASLRAHYLQPME